VLRDAESWNAPPDNEDVCDPKHGSLAGYYSSILDKFADNLGLFRIFHPMKSEIYFI
jgi:hypothetical protein